MSILFSLSREQAENEVVEKEEEKTEVEPSRENKAKAKEEEKEITPRGEDTHRSPQRIEKVPSSSSSSCSSSLSSSFLRMIISETPLRKLCTFPYSSLPFNATGDRDSSGATEESSTQQGILSGDESHHHHHHDLPGVSFGDSTQHHVSSSLSDSSSSSLSSVTASLSTPLSNEGVRTG